MAAKRQLSDLSGRTRGLLIAAKHRPSMEAAFREHDVAFARIGEVVAGEAGRISVAGSLLP